MREDARRAVDLLLTRWSEFSDLRAIADMRLDYRNDKQQFTGVVLLKRPTLFRFEALSPFGQPMVLASIFEGQITIYDASSNSATIGPATPEIAVQLIQLAIEPEDLVGFFAGLAVPPKDLRVATILPADEHGPSLEMVGTIHTQRVWMDLKTGVVRRLRITGGRLDALAIFDRTADDSLDGFDLTAAQGHVTGSVRYRDLVIGSGIEAERFRLQIPGGVTIDWLR